MTIVQKTEQPNGLHLLLHNLSSCTTIMFDSFIVIVAIRKGSMFIHILPFPIKPDIYQQILCSAKTL